MQKREEAAQRSSGRQAYRSFPSRGSICVTSSGASDEGKRCAIPVQGVSQEDRICGCRWRNDFARKGKDLEANRRFRSTREFARSRVHGRNYERIASKCPATEQGRRRKFHFGNSRGLELLRLVQGIKQDLFQIFVAEAVSGRLKFCGLYALAG